MLQHRLLGQEAAHKNIHKHTNIDNKMNKIDIQYKIYT